MSTKAQAPKRPAELTLVVVLTYISAIASIVFGVLLILARYGVPASDGGLRGFVTIVGAAVVLIGFMTVAIASGIARGDRSARVIATVLLGLSLAASIVSAIADPGDLWSQAVNVVISGGAITVMWTGRTAHYFARAAAA